MLKAVLVHVGVLTTDLPRSLRFWRDLLGMQVLETRPRLAILSDGMHNITLTERIAGESAGVDGESAPVHIGVGVEDLDAALRGCLDLGLEITCNDIDNCRPYDPEDPPKESFKAEGGDGVVIDFTASTTQWLGVTI